MNLLDGLNKEQKQAVIVDNNRVLVLAGAGTGKTTTLVKRISRLLMDGVNPEQIMAVTFTNKAAKEIKIRLHELLGGKFDTYMVEIGTFHGICNKIIRGNAEKLGLKSNYQIIDTSEQKNIFKNIIKENIENLEIDDTLDIKESHILKISMNKITRLKEDGVLWSETKNPADVDWDMVEIFRLYEEYKDASGLLDFTDLLIYGVRVMENKELQEHYSYIYEHMLVDEFQDTNKLQMKWINLLNPENLFVVGDDDQSIYKFRGAEVKNILEFVNNNNGAESINLEQNYRSTPNILNVANSIIDYNEFRHYKKLWTDKEGGEDVSVLKCISANDEAKKIVNKIKELLSFGVEGKNIAVVYRSNHLSRLLEKPLMREGIGYQITGGVGFWQRKEIKDILSYFVLMQNRNNYIAFERSVKYPLRGIGGKTIQKIVNFAKEEGIDCIESISKLVGGGTIKGKAAGSLLEYINIVDGVVGDDIADCIEHIMKSVNVDELYKDEDDSDRLDNVNELLAAAIESDDEGIKKDEFLSNAQLMGSVDDKSKDDSVSLTTIHSAKGLEFDYVFIIGMEDGVFPSQRSLGTQEDLEEERRLCYVGATRAKKKLVLSHAMTRSFGGNFNKPSYISRFISEIPDKLITRVKRL